jgi:CelD/BcsL family acetyltransferase involved in cellulose biosynthesis
MRAIKKPKGKVPFVEIAAAHRHGHKKVVCEEGSANGQPLLLLPCLTFHCSFKVSRLIIF